MKMEEIFGGQAGIQYIEALGFLYIRANANFFFGLLLNVNMHFDSLIRTPLRAGGNSGGIQDFPDGEWAQNTEWRRGQRRHIIWLILPEKLHKNEKNNRVSPKPTNA